MPVSKSKYRTSGGARRPSDFGVPSRREHRAHSHTNSGLTQRINIINDIRYYNKIELLLDPPYENKETGEKYEIRKEDNKFSEDFGKVYGKIGGIEVIIEITKEGKGYISVKSNEDDLKEVYKKVLNRIIAGKISIS
jgi:hypothetical protein